LGTHPLVRLRILVRGWEELTPRLRSREMTLFVADTGALDGEPELDIEPLPRHPVYYVARAGHPLARRAPIGAHDTHAYPFVTISRLPPRILQPIHDSRDGLALPGRPFPAIELSDLAGITRILERSDAISGLALPGIAEQLDRGRLVVLGREAWMETAYGIVRLKGESPSAATAALCECIRQAESEMGRQEAALVARHAPVSKRRPPRPTKPRA
jgi:DNA-binding transcriptional LysR family regulator